MICSHFHENLILLLLSTHFRRRFEIHFLCQQTNTNNQTEKREFRLNNLEARMLEINLINLMLRISWFRRRWHIMRIQIKQTNQLAKGGLMVIWSWTVSNKLRHLAGKIFNQSQLSLLVFFTMLITLVSTGHFSPNFLP